MWSDAELIRAKPHDIPAAMRPRRGLIGIKNALMVAAAACEFWDGETAKSVAKALRAGAAALVE